ncbi:MAG: hypothetical protein ACU0AZ_07750 [Paracoccaceae bacterium]
MKRFMIAFLILFSFAANAQDLQPIIEVELSEEEVVPGQFVELRITLLVPTWMPDTPLWPTYDSPNFLVRLPERSSTPTSRDIEGETWSGISRRYQISPMVPGSYSLPSQQVRVTYAEIGGGEPKSANLTIPDLTLTGVVPAAAEGLEPFIAAKELVLTQEISGSPENLEAGGSFSRMLKVELDGLAPMFLPELTPESEIDGLRSYPKSPVLDEKEERGDVSGSRTEVTEYVAEGDVDAALSGVSLSWFNLTSQEVETATVPAVPVVATAPVTQPDLAISGRQIAGALMVVMIVTFGLWLFKRFLRPAIYRQLRRKRQRYEAGEAFTHRQLLDAIARRDLRASYTTYDEWSRRCGGLPDAISNQFTEAFESIGQARFGVDRSSNADQEWDVLKKVAQQVVRHKTKRDSAPALPSLNPVNA